MKPNVAIVDDEPRMGEILSMILRRAEVETHVFGSGFELMEAMKEDHFDVVVSDLKMPGMSGMDLLRTLKEEHPDVPVVIVTAHGTVRTAVEALRDGAFDFIEKPFDNDLCRAVVRRALDVTQLSRENRYLRAELAEQFALDDVVISSPEMTKVYSLAKRAARSRSTVLIRGQSGTGKELLARSIHFYSDRVGEPFVAVNCKAFSTGVLESELFGHAKGAFTGADRRRKGVFERAHGGTVFLDEIGEVGLDFQAKLLRVIQEREVQPVGADDPVPIDVRVLAATNKDLKAEVETGNFREDLYFRLAVIPIVIPPLADRRADILPLADKFLRQFQTEMGVEFEGWTDEVESFLKTHDWPGNVRQLQNVIERAVVLAPGPQITMDDLMLESSTPGPDGDETLQEFLDRMTLKKVQEALDAADGQKAKAAASLGVDRTTLYRLMKRLT